MLDPCSGSLFATISTLVIFPILLARQERRAFSLGRRHGRWLQHETDWRAATALNISRRINFESKTRRDCGEIEYSTGSGKGTQTVGTLHHRQHPHRPAGQAQGGTIKTFAPPGQHHPGPGRSGGWSRTRPRNPRRRNGQEPLAKAEHPALIPRRAGRRPRPRGKRFLQDRTGRHPPRDEANTGGESRRNPARLSPRLRPGASPR